MTIGTKSVLFGAHCFFLHPFFVARAWWNLYGFPWDPRLWVAFAVHDIGYIGKPNMDGDEGETHPEVGAAIMEYFFDNPRYDLRSAGCSSLFDWWAKGKPELKLIGRDWHDFTLLHSRYYAKKLGRQPSRLCIADKLAICLTPWWLYLPLVNLTGEVREYMKNAQSRAQVHERLNTEERHGLLSGDQKLWYTGLQKYMRRWVEEHRDGKEDSWTQRKEAA